MRKSFIFILTLLLVVLTGCSSQTKHSTTSNSKKRTPDTVKTTTLKTINTGTKTWTFSQSVDSKQTKKHGVASELSQSAVAKTNTLNNWTTTNGKFSLYSVDYQQVSLAKWQQAQRKHVVKSYQKTMHYMTVPQVNAVLKKLGANFKIYKLTDLIYLTTKTSDMPVEQAFVAKGHHLYGINIEYRDTDTTTTITRGTAYTDKTAGKTTKHIAISKLNGTWIAAKTTTSASDTGKIMIKDGYLYQHRYDSYERSALQDLSTYSLASLNQNTTYAGYKHDATQAGYDLSHTAIASGDSSGYLYLFVNQNKLVRIAQGQVTTYTKTSAIVAASDLPLADQQIFEQMDQKKPGSSASTITVKADAPIVGLSSSIKYLTDPEAGQITSNQAIEFKNGKLILKH